MKEQSIKYLLGKGSPALQAVKNDRTRRAYCRHTAIFAAWLSEHGIKRKSQLQGKYDGLGGAIQAWADDLASQGKSASTIHTYAAAVCVAAGIPLGQIRKPKRITSENTRSRTTGKNARAEKEEASGNHDRLLNFQKAVGIRRAELARLSGRDLVKDEAGKMCVLVRKGKGGKRQMQRILPADQETVAAYFDGTDKRIFSPAEMRNHLDLHAIRAAQAKRAYDYYATLSDQEREELRQEITARYLAAAPNPEKLARFLQQIDKGGGVYQLRGATRKAAEAAGIPTTYDRLALMAVSVFHLSHWRLDVTVCNYITAI